MSTFTQRKQAFDVLSSKSGLTQAFNKTEMCRTRMKGKKCKNPTCSYAHSKEELKVKMCSFGRACKFLYGKTRCAFPHDFETPEMYKKRTSREYPTTDHIVVPEIVKVTPSDIQCREEIAEVNRIRKIFAQEESSQDTSSLSSVTDSMDFSELKAELNRTLDNDDDDNVSINLGPLSRQGSMSSDVLSVSCSGRSDCDPIVTTLKISLTTEQLSKLIPFLSSNKISFSSC